MFLLPTLNCLSESRMSRIWLDMPLTKIYKITWPQRVRQIQQLRHTPRITEGASSRLVFGILGMSGALPPIPKNGSGWRIAVNFFGGYTATRFETLHGRSAETFDRLTLFIVCWGIWCRMRYGITALPHFQASDLMSGNPCQDEFCTQMIQKSHLNRLNPDK